MTSILAIITLDMTLLTVDCSAHMIDGGDEESAINWAMEKNLPGITEIANYSFFTSTQDAHDWAHRMGVQF